MKESLVDYDGKRPLFSRADCAQQIRPARLGRRAGGKPGSHGSVEAARENPTLYRRRGCVLMSATSADHCDPGRPPGRGHRVGVGCIRSGRICTNAARDVPGRNVARPGVTRNAGDQGRRHVPGRRSRPFRHRRSGGERVRRVRLRSAEARLWRAHGLSGRTPSQRSESRAGAGCLESTRLGRRPDVHVRDPQERAFLHRKAGHGERRLPRRNEKGRPYERSRSAPRVPPSGSHTVDPRSDWLAH
jgi:hypothetical protein